MGRVPLWRRLFFYGSGAAMIAILLWMISVAHVGGPLWGAVGFCLGLLMLLSVPPDLNLKNKRSR